MSSANFTYLDTYASKPTTIQVPTLDFGKDFALKSNSGSEAILVNTTANLDSPETVRLAINNIANVYSGEADIDPSLYAPNKRGKSLVCSIKDALDCVDDAGNHVVYPIQAHFVVKFPIAGQVTADKIQKVALRMVALMNNGAIQKTSGGAYVPVEDTNGVIVRFNEELRGALAPDDTVVKDYGA